MKVKETDLSDAKKQRTEDEIRFVFRCAPLWGVSKRAHVLTHE